MMKKKIQTRFQLALRDENIATCKLASAPRGIVKIRNGSVGCELSAIGVNENIRDEVCFSPFLVCHRKYVYTHVYVYVRGTAAKLRELSHANVSGMYTRSER